MTEGVPGGAGQVTEGVLVVDKPAGMTSHDVVDEVRRRLSTRRVGHAGTLDPDATGLLLLGVGRATRFLSYGQSSPKRYRASAVFGVTTSTQDASGDILRRRPAGDLTRRALGDALGDFVGEVDQVPPMVSAVKVGGERLYLKARRGEEVERRARRVTIYSLELVGFRAGAVPQAALDVHCSAGTYVRTLVADLGEHLGCGAHLGSLRRIEAAGFTEADAVPLAEVTRDALRPLVDAVRELPRLEADEDAVRRVGHGRPLAARPDLGEGEEVAIVRDSTLLGVYARSGSVLVPRRVVGS
ncbi:tRNA pseudouridine(55) synthase TruB [soil metagenome]